jgi:predicted nucleic-acid-binding Zn-ribbon protein
LPPRILGQRRHINGDVAHQAADTKEENCERDYTCPKCGGRAYETRELRGAGGFWSKIFDVQGQRFTTVICERCRYTELFHAETSKLGNIFDLFTN